MLLLCVEIIINIFYSIIMEIITDEVWYLTVAF